MQRRFAAAFAGLTLTAVVAFASRQMRGDAAYSFAVPVDGISVTFDDWGTHRVRGLTDGGWTEWQDIARDEEHPDTTESTLALFPKAVSRIELDTTVAFDDIHPIRISGEPVSYLEASRTTAGTPRILSRSEWKADDSLLYYKQTPPAQTESTEDRENDSTTTTPGTVSKRVQDCMDAQANYPGEFKVAKTVTKNADGQTYLWPLQYSKSVKMLVVHHTAMQTAGRTGPELMRALYQYHAVSKGWGDVGYNYVVDSEGQIYQGKAGGDYVIAGHAYCNNINTMGIALMGNFDQDEPTQEQMKSLKWLLDMLATKYRIDPSANITFHGVSRPTIVGHGDLLSTDCPGYYVHGALAQVRTQVADGDLTALVTFPPPRGGEESSKQWQDKAAQRRMARGDSTLPATPPSAAPVFKEGLTALGNTTLQGRPGDEILVSMRFVAGDKRIDAGKSVGTIVRSSNDIDMYQLLNGTYERVRLSVVTTEMVPAHGSTQLQLKVRLPQAQGLYTLGVGDALFTLSVSGRSTTARQRTPSVPMTSTRASSSQAAVSRSSRPTQRASATSAPSVFDGSSPTIRIRLSYAENDASVTLSDGDIVSLANDGTQCVATQGGKPYKQGTVRLGSADGSFTVTSWKTSYNRFRGVLECRVIDGQLVLIDELPLEDYMAGISEEPDSEPYEKQRAFAIAARTYAAFYLGTDKDHRKFPGMPYDGSDSPALFQKYSGMNIETQYPNWVKAVHGTAGTVLKKNDQIIKPPYFSSDDGRTRSPAEAGWKTFPFMEIFTSKADPWCEGMTLRGHGVGMSGCGAEGQANEGKTGEDILQYYYPSTELKSL